MPDSYSLHSAGRKVLLGAGIVMVLMIFMAPVGLIVFYYVLRSKIVFGEHDMTSYGLTTKTLHRDDVSRIGLYYAPTPRGIAGFFNRIVVGGDVGVNLCWCDPRGKTKWVNISRFERHEEIIDRAVTMTGLPVEQLTMGFTGVKWP